MKAALFIALAATALVAYVGSRSADLRAARQDLADRADHATTAGLPWCGGKRLELPRPVRKPAYTGDLDDQRRR